MIFLDSGEKLKMSLLEARRKRKGNNSREPADVKPTPILWVLQGEKKKAVRGILAFQYFYFPLLTFSRVPQDITWPNCSLCLEWKGGRQ